MLKSIQWKMVVIYFLLILLAMEVIGVYLSQSLERYYLHSFSSSLESQAQLMAGFLERYMRQAPDGPRVDSLVQEFSRQAGLDIVIVDKMAAVIGASTSADARKGERYIRPEITRALAGGQSKAIRTDGESGERRLHLSVPISSGGQILGAVYLTASLEKTYRTLGDIKVILLSATSLALALTSILALALARTITTPIRELTSRAARMAAGDFEERIELHSQDEIGQLGAMFNYLTERLKNTLGEMSREKSRMEAILTHMADGIVAVDSSQRVLIVNPAAARMLNTTPEKAAAAPEEFLAQTGLAQVIKQSQAGEVPSSGRLELSKPPRVIRTQLASLGNQRGDKAGVVVVLQDVTEQERLEKLRKDFVANVSHELRTPLTTMKSYLETLLDGAVDDPGLARRFLGVALAETDRMIRLVRELLSLSRLDFQRGKAVLRAIDWCEFVRGTVDKLRVPAEKKDLSVVTRIPARCSLVRVDPDQMEQVLQNIIGNAIEFTPAGGRVEVSVDLQDGYLRTVVSDTGIGIPREDLPRIFERFYRVDKARSRSLGGTGLGLSIAREIVEAHGGAIKIESALNRGTRVTFTVPQGTKGPVDGRSQKRMPLKRGEPR